MIFGRTVAACALPIMLLSCSPEQETAPAPVAVDIIVANEQNRTLHLAYTAITKGQREVDIHARVSGILERRLFEEGATVAAGTTLFRIDPAPYAAAVRNAEGRLGIERARLVNAEQQHSRITSLHRSGFATGRGRDQAEADLMAARSAVASARAELDRARLDLSYTHVRAPISGITGTESRSEGSLIDATSPESSLLTTITQADSLYVDFGMPQEEAQLLQDAMKDGTILVRLMADNGQIELGRAPITFVDTRVDPDTGTVNVRATLKDGTRQLMPGQFIKAQVTGIPAPKGVFVPARAITRGAEGPYVWKVDAQNKATVQPVTLGTPLVNLVRIIKGVAPADKIIVAGMLKLQPGTPVKTALASESTR